MSLMCAQAHYEAAVASGRHAGMSDWRASTKPTACRPPPPTSAGQQLEVRPHMQLPSPCVGCCITATHEALHGTVPHVDQIHQSATPPKECIPAPEGGGVNLPAYITGGGSWPGTMALVFYQIYGTTMRSTAVLPYWTGVTFHGIRHKKSSAGH
jgi:hypothetical protein